MTTEDDLRALRGDLVIDRDIALDLASRLGERVWDIDRIISELQPPPPPPPVGQVWRLPTGQPTGVIWDMEEAATEIRRRFGGDEGIGWPVGFVESSSGIQFTADGGVLVHLDPARRQDDPNSGGANWVNFAMPLANPGQHVRLSYDLTAPADFGQSTKLFGLSTITGDQRAPGGGYCGAGQMIARPVLSDYNRDDNAWIGPYVYWPVEANQGSENVIATPVHASGPLRLWHPDRSGYALWWYGHRDAVYRPFETHHCSIEVELLTSGLGRITEIDGNFVCTYTMPAGATPTVINKLAGVCMSGWDASSGPSESVVVRFDNLQVETIR